MVPAYKIREIEEVSGLKFDTLLIDCEGCAQYMMDELGPVIKSQVRTILVEADMGNDGGDCTANCMDYKKFFAYLVLNGFKQVDKFNDCDKTRTMAPEGTWCGGWILHYAYVKTSVPEASTSVAVDPPTSARPAQSSVRVVKPTAT